MPEFKTLRLGFVGAGVRGRLFANLALRHPDVEVVGVHDLSPTAARAFSDETGVPILNGIEALIREGLDSLVVATPDHVHAEAVLAGAAAGLHLLVEKPLATTTRDAVAMRSAVRDHAARVSVAYLNRWHPAFRNILADADSGALGRVLFQNARLSNSLRVPLKALSWARHSSPGWFLMPHTLDIVAALAPKGRTVVQAVGSRGVLASHGVDTWDGLQALLAFEDGSSASVESLWVLPDGMPAPVRFGYEVVGEHASAVVEDSRQGLEIYRAASTEFPRALVSAYDDMPMGPNVTMLDAFIQTLRDGHKRLPDLDEAMWVSQLIEAVHTAAAERAAVTVEPA
ncbi:Gfo/Idh/MocA family oxidoreductase [Tessaracoccus sp. OS52]|uniref:Gfo/Idh/MocA family protein n=1 Tax=Tessaracoccus sp. OS52 TaxID=2886691 RepID=UPI001D0FDBF9|nr:Gfo/Idh/MocA family oxidoreductase [Tessaracoccus sp. OS52]MCC2593690.1 Gfo/Idh/MocA family oxidoreductase [Tessaracoccus sp. OS52]